MFRIGIGGSSEKPLGTGEGMDPGKKGNTSPKGGRDMLVKDVMSRQVVTVSETESAALAARLLERHNLGALPVCSAKGQLTGMLTDRDLALRCLAAGRDPEKTPVGQVMSRHVVSAALDTPDREAARLMGAHQVRRLPVTQNGRVVGMVSLADLARRPDCSMEAGECLGRISAGLRRAED